MCVCVCVCHVCVSDCISTACVLLYTALVRFHQTSGKRGGSRISRMYIHPGYSVYVV